MPSSEGSSRIEPREHALGDHLDARALGNLRAEAHAQADGVAHLLAQGRRHARGGGARGQPARLQHQDFLILCPRLVEQHQRHARGLAGARRRHQHGGIVRRPAPRSAAAARRRWEVEYRNLRMCFGVVIRRSGDPGSTIANQLYWKILPVPALARGTTTSIGRRRCSFRRPPDALIGEAVARDFLRPVDVAQVDQHRLAPSPSSAARNRARGTAPIRSRSPARKRPRRNHRRRCRRRHWSSSGFACSMPAGS